MFNKKNFLFVTLMVLFAGCGTDENSSLNQVELPK